MERKDLAKELVAIVGAMVEVEERGAVVADLSPEAVLRDVREAQMLVASIDGKKLKMAAAPRTSIKEIPGFSPQQLRTAIDQIVKIRQKSTAIRTQYEAVLKQLTGLDAEEKKGLAALRIAAAQMKQKERFLVDAEQGMLEFTAFLQDKVPGVQQMLDDPETSKFGDKAGDFFGRVGARLGKKVQEAVEGIYTETKDDLTHAADAITGFKVVAKTASVKSSTMKKAGVTDAVISIKEWLTGQVDSLSKRFLNFAGDIKRWVKGFVERTKMVKNNTGELLKALDDAKGSIDSALA